MHIIIMTSGVSEELRVCAEGLCRNNRGLIFYAYKQNAYKDLSTRCVSKGVALYP